jgi:hypothetical protein
MIRRISPDRFEEAVVQGRDLHREISDLDWQIDKLEDQRNELVEKLHTIARRLPDEQQLRRWGKWLGVTRELARELRERWREQGR